MPRSIQDILDHADELAARFENYEPEPTDERPVEEYLLERAAIARETLAYAGVAYLILMALLWHILRRRV